MDLLHHCAEPAIAISVVAAALFAPSFERAVHLAAVLAALLAARGTAYVTKREYIETFDVSITCTGNGCGYMQGSHNRSMCECW